MNNLDLEELRAYADLEGTEVGDYVSLLLALKEQCSWQMEVSFANELDEELMRQLTMFRTRTKIVERTVTETRTIRELEWDGE